MPLIINYERRCAHTEARWCVTYPSMERGNEVKSAAKLQDAEVNLNPHAQIKERDVRIRGNPFRVPADSRDKHALALNKKAPFKLLWGMPRVGGENPPKPLIHFLKGIAVVHSLR